MAVTQKVSVLSVKQYSYNDGWLFSCLYVSSFFFQWLTEIWHRHKRGSLFWTTYLQKFILRSFLSNQLGKTSSQYHYKYKGGLLWWFYPNNKAPLWHFMQVLTLCKWTTWGLEPQPTSLAGEVCGSETGPRRWRKSRGKNGCIWLWTASVKNDISVFAHAGLSKYCLSLQCDHTTKLHN